MRSVCCRKKWLQSLFLSLGSSLCYRVFSESIYRMFSVFFLFSNCSVLLKDKFKFHSCFSTTQTLIRRWILIIIKTASSFIPTICTFSECCVVSPAFRRRAGALCYTCHQIAHVTVVNRIECSRVFFT